MAPVSQDKKAEYIYDAIRSICNMHNHRTVTGSREWEFIGNVHSGSFYKNITGIHYLEQPDILENIRVINWQIYVTVTTSEIEKSPKKCSWLDMFLARLEKPGQSLESCQAPIQCNLWYDPMEITYNDMPVGINMVQSIDADGKNYAVFPVCFRWYEEESPDGVTTGRTIICVYDPCEEQC